MTTEDPIASRYAQAVFGAAKSDHALDETLAQLHLVAEVVHQHADLQQLLRNPGIDPAEKVTLLDRALKGTWSALVRAGVEMMIQLGRAEYLEAMAQAFQEFVDDEEGRLRVVVRSARALPDPILHRLRKGLERQEHKHIELHPEIAPELLGGLQVIIGYRVIDGSVRRQLAELKDHLSTVRVHGHDATSS